MKSNLLISFIVSFAISNTCSALEFVEKDFTAINRACFEGNSLSATSEAIQQLQEDSEEWCTDLNGALDDFIDPNSVTITITNNLPSEIGCAGEATVKAKRRCHLTD